MWMYEPAGYSRIWGTHELHAGAFNGAGISGKAVCVGKAGPNSWHHLVSSLPPPHFREVLYLPPRWWGKPSPEAQVADFSVLRLPFRFLFFLESVLLFCYLGGFVYGDDVITYNSSTALYLKMARPSISMQMLYRNPCFCNLWMTPASHMHKAARVTEVCKLGRVCTLERAGVSGKCGLLSWQGMWWLNLHKDKCDASSCCCLRDLFKRGRCTHFVSVTEWVQHILGRASPLRRAVDPLPEMWGRMEGRPSPIPAQPSSCWLLE